MSIKKITATEVERASVENLGNRPNNKMGFGQSGLSAAELKERFTALAKLAINKVNEVIDAFGSDTEESDILSALYVAIQDETDDEKKMTLSAWVSRVEQLLKDNALDRDEVESIVKEAVMEYMPDVYDGEHIVTPMVDGQTLGTAQKIVQEDIVVEAIPYSEVSNETNGKTVTIG